MAERARSSALRAIWRISLLVAVTCVFYVINLTLRCLTFRPERRLAISSWFAIRWHPWLCHTVGMQVEVKGELPEGAAFLAPNHLGYVDIVPLTRFGCFFIAKADVHGWPGVNMLFKGTGQATVDRSSRQGLKDAVQIVRERLRGGFKVTVFLEGTSTGGDRVLPFKGGLIQPVIDEGAPLVPIGIRYRPGPDPAVDVAEDVAYWKDHVFAPHVWRLIGLEGLIAELHIAEPIPTRDLEGNPVDRKWLAEEARRRVVALLGLKEVLEPESEPLPPESELAPALVESGSTAE